MRKPVARSERAPRDPATAEPALAATISLRPAPSPSDLARLWRTLEARSDCSFFQSWTYTGCLIGERFPAPVLLEARAGSEVIALALFNRRHDWLGPRRLFLGESGITSFDKIFIEHNGPLIARGFASVLPDLLSAALRAPIGPRSRPARHSLVLSGVDEAVLLAARNTGAVLRHPRTRLSPAVDLAALRRTNSNELDPLSANTRYQIRRAERCFGTFGPLTIRRAQTTDEAHRWLDSLAALHQETWRARGKPGAFADANFRRFHHALIDRGLVRGEVDVLEIAAGKRILGYLLNFVFHGCVYAYQSGFDYHLRHRHEKPGLTCHHLAIAMYAREGRDRYDFLGGAERYKTSFASEAAALHWMTLEPRWSVRGMAARVRRSWIPHVRTPRLVQRHPEHNHHPGGSEDARGVGSADAPTCPRAPSG